MSIFDDNKRPTLVRLSVVSVACLFYRIPFVQNPIKQMMVSCVDESANNQS
ncbi:hypothetical protein [Aeribacillus pallidus]|uniref:hypothetical protein n=1 Tax=Aeribacillus pallidus TaxID=33936 RepID=UPI003D2309EF